MSTPSVCNAAALQQHHVVLTRGRSTILYSNPEKRKGEAERIRQKYPDRIPVSVRTPHSPQSRLAVVSIKVAC